MTPHSTHHSLLPKAMHGFTHGDHMVPVEKKKTSGNESIVNFLKKKVTMQHIHGQLVHKNGDPMNGQKIALFSEGWIKDCKIDGTETITDKDGKFSMRYQWKHRPYEWVHNVVFKVYEETVPSEMRIGDRMVGSIHRSIPIHHDPYDLGKVKASLYEAQDGFPGLLVDNFKHRPQQSTTGFNFELVTDIAKQVLSTLKGCVGRLFSADGGDNTPDGKGRDAKLSSENTKEFFLNGTYAAQFRKGKDDSEFVNVINWGASQRAPAPPVLANTKLIFKKENDKLHLKEITIQPQEKPAQVYTPAAIEGKENPEFPDIAHFITCSSAFVKGEAEDHLARHLMLGQIALSFFRHINSHPIKKLLTPHLQGVMEINRLGAGLIFGETGILTLSALPPAEIDKLLKANLSWMDFATYAPRQPIAPEHRFARGQQLYWEVVTKVVDQFFVENAEGIRSKDTWHELYYMSQNLMKESLPYAPPQSEGEAPEWIDRSEMDQPEVGGRVEYNGHLRAVRPFITSKNTPNDGDIEKLKQLCRYVLFIATFYHWAIHMSQEWGTNVEFASLAPEIIGEGAEATGTTAPLKAARQAVVAKTLVNFKAPTIFENQDRSIYQPLIDMLLAYKEEFAKLGYDVEAIHSAIWI